VEPEQVRRLSLLRPRKAGILTVAVVTKPFLFEGAPRMRAAEHGIERLSECADTVIVVPNQNLFRVADTKTTFADAFPWFDRECQHEAVSGER
jgi:cell division protein FtsZ